MEEKDLMAAAVRARSLSYAPYSKFCVGAALLTKSGKIYLGCNIECASSSPTVCAERTAFFKAVSEGERDFLAIAVVGGPVGQPPLGLCAPCGVCRQVMREFCDPASFRVLLGSGQDQWNSYLLEELLPLSFGPDDLVTERAEDG